ncbi:MAG: efflux RND transporter periplasmic adaptor subunit, partial [Planctomycetaceae bacterium]|nr:efflux RND transporter periplasmic adaptor subunit [Planctomycetaceae bacterium]
EESAKTEPKKEEAKKEEPKKEEPKPDTVELKKEPLRITVKLSGLFESKQAGTVQLKAKEFAAFELQEVVPHGTRVRKGDVLIKFNPKKYEETLVVKKRDLRLSEIALQEEEINFKYLERTRPIQKEVFERNKKYADDDFVYFFNVEHEWDKKMIDLQIKNSQFRVESTKEELKQLEKMYAEDDLVEDTEEFILKRSKLAAESAQFYYDLNKVEVEHITGTMFPRMELSMKESAKLRELDYQKSQETFNFSLEQAKLKLEKAKETHQKLIESFEKFEKDKQFLTLTSPADGIVYYGEYNGKLSKGKWNNAVVVAGAMKIGETVQSGQVLFTIVDSKPSLIRALVAEKDLHWVNTGTQGVSVPAAFPNSRYKVKVVNRNDIPSPANDYAAILSADLPGSAKIYPNMSCSVELTVYDKKETLLVPATALKREEYEDDSYNHAYLFVADNGKTEKRKVPTGQTKGDRIEILGGIDAGAKVYRKYEDGEKAK